MHRKSHICFILHLVYMCDIIWPPAPFKICYLARNMKELHEPALNYGKWRSVNWNNVWHVQSI